MTPQVESCMVFHVVHEKRFKGQDTSLVTSACSLRWSLSAIWGLPRTDSLRLKSSISTIQGQRKWLFPLIGVISHSLSPCVIGVSLLLIILSHSSLIGGKGCTIPLVLPPSPCPNVVHRNRLPPKFFIPSCCSVDPPEQRDLDWPTMLPMVLLLPESILKVHASLGYRDTVLVGFVGLSPRKFFSPAHHLIWSGPKFGSSLVTKNFACRSFQLQSLTYLGRAGNPRELLPVM